MRLVNHEHGVSLGPTLQSVGLDFLKIITILFVISFVVGVLRTFVSPEKIKLWMVHRKFRSYLGAALLGAVTPFCSCSSIPIFFGFLKAQIPLGVAFTFLVTSPMINEYLVVLMASFWGWKVTVAYVLSGLTLGIMSGALLGRMGLEKYLVKDIIAETHQESMFSSTMSLKARIDFALNEALLMVKKIWFWILVGMGIGVILDYFLSAKNIQTIIGQSGVFSVPFAVLLGVPLYGSCASILPVAVVLLKKGLPLGTVLAFLMAVSALSLPEAVILKRVLKLKLIILFFGVVALGIMLTGYIFNALQMVLLR